MLECDQASAGRQDHADRIEAHGLGARSIGARALREPLTGHPSEPIPLSRADRVQRTRGPAQRAREPCLHLTEHERELVGCHDVELTETRPEVTREDAVTAVLEMLLSDPLAELAVPASEVDRHAGEATRRAVTAGLRTQKLRYGCVTFS